MEGPTIDRIARAFAARDSRRGWLRAAAVFAVALSAERATAAPTAAHKAAPAAACAGNGDCAACHWCDAGACRPLPNGADCSAGLGVCKKGHCRIAAPKLLVTSTPPCVATSVSGLAPETLSHFSLSSPCFPVAIDGEVVQANGVVVFDTVCGNCPALCPGTTSTAVTVSVTGIAAKGSKPFKATKVLKNVACPLSSSE